MAKKNEKNAAKTSNKINFGVLRDAKHAGVMNLIAGWKKERDTMAIESMERKGLIEALRLEYKGFLVEKQWIVNDKAKQEEYNLKESQIVEKYRELTRVHKAAINEIYNSVYPNGFFESYEAYMAVGSTQEVKEEYLAKMESFLKLGLKVPFGPQGLKYAAVELVKGVGKQVNGLNAAYKTDRDAVVYKKSRFNDAVMANLRSILQDKGIIAVNPIENPKSKSEKKSEKKSKTENEIQNPDRIQKATPVKKPDEFPEAKAEIKKTATRNRGVKKESAKRNPKVETKIETEIQNQNPDQELTLEEMMALATK